ncbi:M56 family metallopeptidase [Tomitella fengzijianii]|uniref:M56 family metallopeptidase n=1 Tax=Tomitella fengzijianii TaxID=2597660 RepID=A0A516X1P4_9ACTN|nr:M56 family metallopeptidase [Tomitella fengzijianii]QDQ96988.1 M56 family metallopeptidase [Tomitella fengzijianii]
MIAALGLLIATLVVGFGAPRYLSVTVAPGLHPRLALAAWTASMTLVLGALIAVPVSLMTKPGRTTFGAAHVCLQQLREDGTLPWLPAVEVATTAALGGLVLFVAVTVARRLRTRRTSEAKLLLEVNRLADSRTAHRGFPVLWVDADEPVCYSVGGAAPTIIASGHIRRLPTAERAAVLDHEAAHLHGRHHALVGLAEATAAALPFIPLFARAPDAVRTLVEFSADNRAAHSNGAGTVGAALLTVHEFAAGTPYAAPVAGLALSGDAVAARLCWLSACPDRGRRRWAAADYPLAVTVAVVPVVVSIASALTAAAIVCLRLSS